MRNLVFFICICSVLLSCGDRDNGKAKQLPQGFALTISDGQMSHPQAIKYILTADNVKIGIYKGQNMNDKLDTTLFTTVLDTKIIQKISEYTIDTLQELYTNPCTSDGRIINLQLKKFEEKKAVELHNYYHPAIEAIFQQVNQAIPEEYWIKYEKDKLIRSQEECAKIIHRTIYDLNWTSTK